MLDLSEIYQKSPAMSPRVQEAFSELMAKQVPPEFRPYKQRGGARPATAATARQKRQKDASEIMRLRDMGLTHREIRSVTGKSSAYICRIISEATQ